jgi:hypothetical protein
VLLELPFQYCTTGASFPILYYWSFLSICDIKMTTDNCITVVTRQ